MDEGGEHHIELVVAREDSSKALETLEKTFDFVATSVELLVVRPRLEASDLRGGPWA